jgi:hypothetical protein
MSVLQSQITEITNLIEFKSAIEKCIKCANIFNKDGSLSITEEEYIFLCGIKFKIDVKLSNLQKELYE